MQLLASLLVVPLLLLSACKSTDLNNTTSSEHQPKTLKNKDMNLKQINNDPDINNRHLAINNFNNANELNALANVRKYLLNAGYVINEAERLSDVNTRYRFLYPALRRDLEEINQAISRFMHHNKYDQTPRHYDPLILKY